MSTIIKYVGKTLFDPVQYAQDSYRITKDTLLTFPPNPLPALTLLAVVVATFQLAQKLFSLQRSVQISDVILFIGAWAGFDAMKQYQTHRLFEKNISQLTQQLSSAEKQLGEWEEWYQTLKGELLTIQQVSSSFGEASHELAEALQKLSHTIELGQKFLREGKQEAQEARHGLRNIIEAKRSVNQEFAALIEELKRSPHQEILALIPRLEQLIDPYGQKIQRLENAIEKLIKECRSTKTCPHCHQTFTPLAAYVKEKKKNVSKSE